MVPRRNINRSGGPLGRKAGLENSQAEKGSFRVGKPVSQEKLSQLLSKTHQARLGYLTAIGSGDKEQVQKAKANWMLLQNKFNSTKGAAELQDAIERGQVPGKRVTESQLPKHPKERIADSKTKAVRYGTDERHKKRKKFEIILFPEYEPSVFLMDVFNQTGNSKLNNQLSAKLGGAGIAILVREVGKERVTINKKSNPLVWMREATQETAELLRENANSIWPRLWFSHGLRPEEATRTVFDEIRTRKRIQAKFESAQELENLIGMVTKASGGFPGWLSIEANEKLIGGVSQETLHRLTAQEVFQSIGKELCEKAAKLGVQRRKMLGEETLAREKAAQAKEQNASESEGGRERQLSEWKRIIDKYGAMGKIGINKKRFSKNSLRNKNAGQERISNYQLVGSSVRFIQLGKDKRKDHFAKIFKWNGREITFNPEGKLFFVQGSFIKKPSPQETPIVRSIEGHGKVDSWEYVFGKQEAIFMKDRRTIASEIHQLSNGAPGVKGPKGKVYRINDEKQLVPVE